MIRILDILFSSLGIILLCPFFLGISLWIRFDSIGPVLYKQKRVGIHGTAFYLYKFRSMYVNSDKKGLITTSNQDPRITHAGHIIRRFKLDELPQLINVLKGDMSLVGPRPELLEFVKLYDDEQKKVLSVRPGITDYASISFRNENEILSKAINPNEYYINTIMPEKLRLNMIYIQNMNAYQYLKIIFLTIF